MQVYIAEPSIPSTMATWSMSPLGNNRGGWGKEAADTHRKAHPILLIIKNLLC